MPPGGTTAGRRTRCSTSALRQIDASNVGQLQRVWWQSAPGPSGRFSFGPLIVDDVMYVVGKDNAVVALEASTGQAALVAGPPGHADQPRLQLLGERRSIRPAPDLRGRQLPPADRRADRRVHPVLRNGQAGSTCGPGCRARATCRAARRARSSRTSSSSARPPARATGRRRATSGRSTCARARWCGRSTPFRVPASSATTPGRRTPGSTPAAPTRGARSRSTCRAASSTSRPDRRPSTSMAATASAPTCSATACWPSMPAPASVSGTSSSCTTICGTTTSWPPRSCSRSATPAGRSTSWRRRARPACCTCSTASRARRSGRSRSGPSRRATCPGEQAWPTQPFTTTPPPFSRQAFSPDDVNPHVDAAEREALTQRLSKARNEGIFTPPTSTREFIVVPGQHGGANFGATAGDPETGMVYVRAIDAPTIHQLRPWDASAVRGRRARRAKSGASRPTRRCARPATARRSRTAFARSIAPASSRSRSWAPIGSGTRSGKGGVRCRPCPRRACRRRPWRRCSPTSRIRPPRPGRRGFRRRCRCPPSTSATPVRSGRRSARRAARRSLGPPWARIVAYDLNAGTIKWAAPLGTVPALAAKGVTDTGNDSRIHRNGLVVTAGGLVFVGHLRRSDRPRVRQGHGPHPVGAPAAGASRGDAGGLRGGRTPVRGVLREHAAGRRRGVGTGLLRLRPGPWPALTAQTSRLPASRRRMAE